MHVTSPSAVRRLAVSTPGRLRDLRPPVPRRPFADGRCPTGSGARGWKRSRSADRRGAFPRPTRARARACWRRPPPRASRASSPSAWSRATSRAGEPRRWVKIKHTLRQELVIGGWLPGEGRRTERIGALLMGCYVRRGLQLRRAGSGPASPSVTLGELARRLAALRRDDEPVWIAARSFPGSAVFVEPCLVAEVEFREWTADGVMRAPSFKGLREDRKCAGGGAREPFAEARQRTPRRTRRRRCSTRWSGCPRGRWRWRPKGAG